MKKKTTPNPRHDIVLFNVAVQDTLIALYNLDMLVGQAYKDVKKGIENGSYRSSLQTTATDLGTGSNAVGSSTEGPVPKTLQAGDGNTASRRFRARNKSLSKQQPRKPATKRLRN